MNQTGELNIATQLCGTKVVERKTGEQLGAVVDAIIHPTAGKLLGITLRTPAGEARSVTADDFSVEAGKILTSQSALSTRERLSHALSGGVYASKEIIGFTVMTEDGRLLGRVREVFLSVRHRTVIYRVAESAWRRLFNGDFFISGDVPQSYSRMGVRLIVPIDTVRQHATTTLAEAI